MRCVNLLALEASRGRESAPFTRSLRQSAVAG